MSIHRFLIIGFVVFAMVAGCSKKKEEAAELEKEMGRIQDTVSESMALDTTAAMPAPVQQEPEPDYATAPAGEGYTVQVAGCEDITYAEYLVEKYTERGYEPYITTANVAGQTYYRVRIGAYESLAEARALKNQLVDRYSIDAWIDYTQ